MRTNVHQFAVNYNCSTYIWLSERLFEYEYEIWDMGIFNIFISVLPCFCLEKFTSYFGLTSIDLTYF